MMPFNHPYVGTNEDRSDLRAFTAGLIASYVRSGVTLSTVGGDFKVKISTAMELELAMLKELTWHYAILNPALATQQYGQRKIIRDLFEAFRSAADNVREHALFPVAFRELLQESGIQAAANDLRTRIVCDFIAGMTERQAFQLHRKLFGISPGSGLH
jgi:dGTPase